MKGRVELEADWLEAADGMTFWGEPVRDLDKASLLKLIGYFVTEKKRVEAQLREREFSAIRIPASGGYPVAE